MTVVILLLCWFSAVSVTAAPKLDERGGAICSTCETIANLLKDELLNDKARSIVKNSIIEMCQKIPAEEISQGAIKLCDKSQRTTSSVTGNMPPELVSLKHTAV
ncbi:hypothetical protein EG68_12448 [Paragonimus skrjabini miyazakii]|uniref:Saposin B-type domain-containing protein n=1 Tax=Paragonimus skrjabini miyazakii TaxID=59628 RepID=A0A8S9Y8E9_9TREM|nr:hypothetical protein EG68_12448 [Paragonimus skrjabini miyazakii]